MADEKEDPGSAWAPIGLLLLVIGGSLLALYVRGDLKNLHPTELFLQAPPEAQIRPTSDTEQGNTYANEELQNSYTIDPNPIQTNPPTP